MKILAIAFACNPSLGSESGVGWGWVTSIAANCDITVITADFNSEAINLYLAHHRSDEENAARFLYVKNRAWHYRPNAFWLKVENSLARPLVNLAYQSWLGYAYEDAMRELNTNRYDLVHLITMVGWRFPGKFYQLRIPFVWGPIGGLKNTPWRLLPILGVSGMLHYGVRNIINSLQIKMLHGPRRALQAADEGVIAATSEIQQELRKNFNANSSVICEVGPPNSSAVDPKSRTDNEPLRICWSGNHTPGKALHLLIRAVALLPSDMNYSLEILGDGPRTLVWRALASRLSVDDHCHWHGKLPRDEALIVMRDSHVFAITSLKDLTSTVAIEAVSLGLPIVCLDHCGFSDLVTEECGIKITTASAEQIISGFASALCSLYRDEPFRMRLARGAIKRSEDYSWAGKAAKLQSIYSRVLKLQSNNNFEDQDQRELILNQNA